MAAVQALLDEGEVVAGGDRQRERPVEQPRYLTRLEGVTDVLDRVVDVSQHRSERAVQSRDAVVEERLDIVEEIREPCVRHLIETAVGPGANPRLPLLGRVRYDEGVGRSRGRPPRGLWSGLRSR